MKNHTYNNDQLVNMPTTYIQNEHRQTTEELYKVLHELRIYQIELEMQNKELRNTREKLEESRNMYAELYDAAPVGYITLTSSGCIHQSNLTAARILRYDRSRVVGKPFVSFVEKKDTDLFFRHLRQCSQDREASTELCLVSSGHTMYVQLTSVFVQQQETSSPCYRTVIIDINKRKRDEVAQQRTVMVEKELIENALCTEREHNLHESEIAYIRAEQLEQQLEATTRELSQIALVLIEKYEWVSVLEKKLKQVFWASPSKSKKLLQQVLYSLNSKLAERDQWNMFEQQLGETNRRFLHSMAATYSSLTPAELKICCLLRLNLSTKEIARLLHTSTKTIENQRYRIRRKINILSGKNLTAFLLSM